MTNGGVRPAFVPGERGRRGRALRLNAAEGPIHPPPQGVTPGAVSNARGHLAPETNRKSVRDVLGPDGADKSVAINRRQPPITPAIRPGAGPRCKGHGLLRAAMRMTFLDCL